MFIVTGKLVLRVLTDLKKAHTHNFFFKKTNLPQKTPTKQKTKAPKQSPQKNKEEIMTEIRKMYLIIL